MTSFPVVTRPIARCRNIGETDPIMAVFMMGNHTLFRLILYGDRYRLHKRSSERPLTFDTTIIRNRIVLHPD